VGRWWFEKKYTIFLKHHGKYRRLYCAECIYLLFLERYQGFINAARVIAFCKQRRVNSGLAKGAIEADQVCSSVLVSLLDCKYQHQMERKEAYYVIVDMVRCKNRTLGLADIFNCGRRLQEKICAIDLIEKSLV